MAGAVPSNTRRSAGHHTGPAIFSPTNSTVLLVFGPRIIHYISLEGRSAARSGGRGSISALHSCMLVCRAWVPVARRYLQKTVLSRIWILAVQQSESISNRSNLSIPPSAYPFLRAARSMCRNPLLRMLLDTGFFSVTSISLGSRSAVIACDVGGLCRTIASLAPLRHLQLVYLAWASSGSNDSQPPVTSHSCAHPHRIDVWAQRDWLLDIHSAHFITWLARSGTASELMEIHFECMMILDEQLLAAVAAVIDASHGSLQDLSLSVSPDLAISPRKYPWSITVDP